ncbi:helix-turn-helix domain-containing protein [Chromobacterium haemolyticum]|uniref:helix-turn-helix domain-containing protein n=1 Tax=Chromobacterium haemolyticum TaxID=394935 RepID=UPI001316AFCC|nr:XRE family transcriptional regulator [Chromobacterium haemolyticum]BBH12118.1 transcriptional regulator [Chromobacterium haemolyticum]
MRTGVVGFQGSRLIQARTARGMTQSALSELSGVSSPSISKWERGEQFPEPAALEKVATALGLPATWFLRAMPDFGKSGYFFRSNTSLTKTARAIASIRLEWLHELSASIQEWIDWPDVNLPVSLSREDALLLTDEEIEDIATQCRKHWRLGMGPIDDVIRVMESAGVITTREPLGYIKMDGVSRWFDAENRPYVFLAADKASSVRSRFDASHELGHLIMHRHLTKADEEERYSELERQAHLFASAFLMPAESISLELAHPTLDTLQVLKRRWKVSIGAMIMRASTLNLIGEAYTTRLWKNYSARGWRKGEPLDNVLEPESPRLMPRAIKMLLEQGGFTKPYLIETIGLPAADIEQLCSLPEGYMTGEMATVIQLNSPVFRPAQTSRAETSTELAQVISLPNRKRM